MIIIIFHEYIGDTKSKKDDDYYEHVIVSWLWNEHRLLINIRPSDGRQGTVVNKN